MRLIDADAYSAEMKERQEAAWNWRNEAIADEDEVKLARAEGAYTAFTEAKLTMDKHIINPWHRVEEPPKEVGCYLVVGFDRHWFYDIVEYFPIDNEWVMNENQSDSTYIRYWMPLPEPPKEDA